MKRVTCSLLALGGVLLAGLGGQHLSSLLHAQAATDKLVWKYGLSFQVRKAGQAKFDDKDTPKYGAEILHDKDIEKLLYVAETGALGVGTADKLGKDLDKPERPKLYHGLEMRVRPKDEKGWDKALKFGAEVFRDINADNLVYISEKGSIGVLPAAGIKAPDKIKDPEWSHGMEVKVRKADEGKFSNITKRVSLEVYRDENTKQLIYLTNDGHIAVTPIGSTIKPTKVKGPTWWHGFVIKVRKADEEKFTK